MDNKELIRQRVCVYAGKHIDIDSDEQVEEILRYKFDIRLPQRKSLNESLTSATSDHEILSLILKYRLMS